MRSGSAARYPPAAGCRAAGSMRGAPPSADADLAEFGLMRKAKDAWFET